MKKKQAKFAYLAPKSGPAKTLFGLKSDHGRPAANGLVWWSCVISKSLQKRRLICAFVVLKPPHPPPPEDRFSHVVAHTIFIYI